MKIVRSVVLTILIVIGISLSADAADRAGHCIVMPGHAVKQKFYTDYQGSKIHFCCRACVRAFKKNPQRYLQNLPENISPKPVGAHKI